MLVKITPFFICCMPLILVGLEEAGIKVWVDVTGLKAGVDFLSKIGQAIIDATVCIRVS